ncbi:hypothetical protein EMIT0P12_20590 [Pseudomonas sp. IT-P12]
MSHPSSRPPFGYPDSGLSFLRHAMASAGSRSTQPMCATNPGDDRPQRLVDTGCRATCPRSPFRCV